MNVEYDASHKASSVTSTTSNASSIWDPLPSLYTGRADSVSSAYEFDDLQEPESFEGFNYDTYHRLQLLHHQKEEETLVAAANAVNASTTDSIVVAENEKGNISELLNSFFKEQETSAALKKEQSVDHEVPSSIDCSHGNKRKRQSSLSEEEQQQQNRELLSDDQKRANHIASEQKRRNTIRGGFKELTEIIPTLKNINNSKSTILFKSVDYIKQLDKRNKSLKERLALLQARVQQKQQKKNPTLIAQKNQQKQLELLQEQLRIQQALLTKHNIPLYGYHNSISIPALDDTPVTSTTTSPTLQHTSFPSSSLVNNIHLHHHASSSSSSAALVMPADDHSSVPSFSIPADDNHLASSNNNTFRERLLSSGKLNHLRRDSYML